MQYIEFREQLKNFKIFNLGDIRKIEAEFDLRRLNEWQKKIYNITKKFPREEMFGLVSQMRRCAVSITSNIAEGFSRQSYFVINL